MNAMKWYHGIRIGGGKPIYNVHKMAYENMLINSGFEWLVIAMPRRIYSCPLVEKGDKVPRS